MESEQHEDSKDSSEESDRTEATNDETGTGRFYECMFCKRGFSTAQALGGHMNIHRRDRARIRQQTLPPLSNRPADDVGNSGFMLQHQLLADHQPHHLSESESLRNYNVYLPPSTSTTRCTQTFFPDNSTARGHRIFGKDFNEGPRSTRLEPMSIKDGEEKNGEFDLELRLGYEP